MSSDSTEEKETKSFQTCKSDTSLLIYESQNVLEKVLLVQDEKKEKEEKKKKRGDEKE